MDRRRLTGCLLAVLMAALSAPPALARSGHATILILYSYHHDIPWQQRVKEGLEPALTAASRSGVTIFEESLGVNRLDPDTTVAALAPYLQQKYANSAIDAVISEDDDAGDFLKNRPELFPAAPRYYINYSGTAEPAAKTPGFDIVGAFGAIVALLPDTRRIVAVGDRSGAVQSYLSAARQVATSRYPQLQLEIWDDLSFAELYERAGRLRRGTVVLYLLAFADRTGEQVIPRDVASRLAQAATVPVFSHWDTMLGTGIVGGWMFSGIEAGRIIGDIVEAIGNGAPLTGDELERRPMLGHFYDEIQLRRWGIDLARLPAGSTLVNRAPLLPQGYAVWIAATLVFAAVETALVVFLLAVMRQRRRALRSLDEERAGLEQRVAERTAELEREKLAKEAALAVMKKVIEDSPIGIILYRAEGDCLLANQAASAIVGGSVTEVLGRNFRSLESWRNAGLLDAALQALAAWRTGRHQCVVRTSFGKNIWIDAQFTPLELDGEPHLLMMILDVTEAQHAAAALAQAKDAAERSAAILTARERFIRAITDHVPCMVGYWDSHLRCRFVNSAYREWFGVEPDAIVGSLLVDLIGEPRFRTDEPKIRGALDGQAQSFEHELIKATGDSGYLWVQFIPDIDDAGAVRGFTVLGFDVTAMKRSQARLLELNEELALARDRAETANRAKSAFLANMSHEIRTPMNAILGLIYLLEQTELTALQREYVEKSELSATSLLGLLSDILDLSKIEADRLDLESVPFRLDELIDTLAVVTAGAADGKNLELLFRMAPETPLCLVGDPLRLQQVLTNLTGNAIKFTPSGDVVLSVAPVRIDGDGAELVFAVSDTGIGIAPAELANIFDAFSQGDPSTTRRYGGSGLGLAICKRLVAMMGGRIEIDSEPGRGSTFRFTARFGLGPQLVAAPGPPAGIPALHTLIVDDNPIACDNTAAMVSQFGWTSTVAYSAGDAVAALDRARAQQQPYHLLLLDWSLAEGGWRKVLDHTGSGDPQEVPQIVVLANPFEQRQARDDGAADPRIAAILVKPLTRSILAGTVAAVCVPTRPQDRARRPTGTLVDTKPLQNLRLLVVDDNSINRMVAQRQLEAAGALVETVASGPEALDLLATAPRRFDVVLMDVQMPGMDGYQATGAIRGSLGLTALPIIAMTANALPADRDRCLTAGMNAHVAKPLDLEHLLATIRDWAGRGREKPALPTGSLPALSGIDLTVGLSRTSGDLALLRDIMRAFIDAYANTGDALDTALRVNDLATLVFIAHDLKTLAASIGAGGLSSLVAELHSAARRANHAAVARLGPQVRDELDTVLASANRFLGPTSGTQPSGTQH